MKPTNNKIVNLIERRGPELNIELLKDLIKDDRGNYYTAIHKEGRELTLVNALVERSYRDVLIDTEHFRKKYAEYEGQFIGKVATDMLRHDVVFAMTADGDDRMYELQDVAVQYRVTFVDTIEFYRNPRTK
jgi:hypothetical protein